ncbi:hypothetical protein ECTW09195_5099, partial [Escherichia coli TW09195]
MYTYSANSYVIN